MPSEALTHEPRRMTVQINARCRIEEKMRRRAKNRSARKSRRINRRK